MIITLDTNALDKLFEDPQARLMLRQAVIAEMAKRVMPKNTSADLRKEIEATLSEVRPELMSLLRDERHIAHIVRDQLHEIRRTIQNTPVKATPETSELVRSIDERVKALITERVEERSGGMLKLVDDAVDRAEERIKTNMDHWIDERVNVRIQAEVDARIEKMRNAL